MTTDWTYCDMAVLRLDSAAGVGAASAFDPENWPADEMVVSIVGIIDRAIVDLERHRLVNS